MHKSFIRPCLEYGDITWNNIDLELRSKLQDIQKDSLRTITGLTRSCSSHNVYTESGLQTLSSCFFYKIRNDLTLQTLHQKLPATIVSIKQHGDIYTLFSCNIIHTSHLPLKSGTNYHPTLKLRRQWRPLNKNYFF